MESSSPCYPRCLSRTGGSGDSDLTFTSARVCFVLPASLHPSLPTDNRPIKAKCHENKLKRADGGASSYTTSCRRKGQERKDNGKIHCSHEDFMS